MYIDQHIQREHNSFQVGLLAVVVKGNLKLPAGKLMYYD